MGSEPCDRSHATALVHRAHVQSVDDPEQPSPHLLPDRELGARYRARFERRAGVSLARRPDVHHLLDAGVLARGLPAGTASPEELRLRSDGLEQLAQDRTRVHGHRDGVRSGTRQLHHVPGQPGGLDRLPLQGRCPAGVGSGDPDAAIRMACGRLGRLRHTRSDRSAHERALGPVPMMERGQTKTFATITVVAAALVLSPPSPEGRGGQGVRTPLPEHPRPDFQRDLWQNLNGPWQFQFDAPDSGEARGWTRGDLPAARAGKRVFLVIGAADWRTTAWLDGRKLGTHDGGYIPFEFELTKYVQT